MPDGASRAFKSWYSALRRVSTSKRSRSVASTRSTLTSSIGTSRPGSIFTSCTWSSERCDSGSKARIESMSSSSSSIRNGVSAPIGYTSSRPPRTAKSPGSITCGTLR